MTGNIWGALLSSLFYLLFQLCGLTLALIILKDKPKCLQLVAGSVLGTVMLQWLPALFAFILGFTLVSHALAAGAALGAAVFTYQRHRRVSGASVGELIKNGLSFNKGILIAAGAIFLVFAFLTVNSFRYENGTVYSSQCTYGDMSMHLGFITSIANQGAFPPEYSILPGTLLAYPFLSDSISSSLYLFGAPVQFAYFLPMLFAGAQVICGFAAFMHLWLKKRAKVIFSALLFFLCGGFGFFYFFSGTQDNPANFTRIFTEFYQTPTNLVDENIRFVNVIVDMMVPQRATLFGWAVLFTALALLLHAVQNKCKRCFVITGILAGTLPMIHTHSFMALGLVAAAWLLLEIIEGAFPKFKLKIIGILLAAFPFIMTLLQFLLKGQKDVPWLIYPLLGVALVLFALVVIVPIFSKKARPCLTGFGIFLGITLLLAVPQVLMWTFKQAQGDQFVRGYFNWGNINDNYLWFYIKNVGVGALLYIPAVLWAKGQNLKIIAPILIIMTVGELAVYQPNTYDNNKIIYLAWFFVCGAVADYAVEMYEKIKDSGGARALAGICVLTCVLSGVLTICREAVSNYELYGKEHVEAAEFIMENSSPDAVVLTDTRHNNSIAALSGRSIVCGAGTYLYFHGLNYNYRTEEIKDFYENPSEELIKNYGVDFIMVSDYERSSYNVDENAVAALFPLVYESGEVRIYSAVKE